MVKNIQKGFNKASNNYNYNGYIQKEIAKKLLNNIEITNNDRIVDLGSGTGIVWELLKNKPEIFLSVDFSNEMLFQHKNDSKIEKLCENFDNPKFWQYLEKWRPSKIISNSALQWSSNLALIFQNLNYFKKNSEIYLSIFTNGTFKELHQYLKIESPILSIKDILKFADNFIYEIINYELEFENSADLLRYIRDSGVSGSLNIANLNLLLKLRRENLIKRISIEIVILKNIKTTNLYN